jgi:hypothetical protein
MLKLNDRVMLNRRHAADFTRRSCGTDWVKRRGVVKRISGNRENIFVLWDDRTSLDQWPAAAIQEASDDSDC